ncbi:MAG: NifB/NifX family molybdenum-iron cluster-binding protein [Desulfoplanes sp.]|nr:NifB/NifX family molybdenum-iron cluster-binding protein [Desulfoplanes sp.]
MKIAISAQQDSLSSPIDPRFGRAQGFIIFDTETKNHQWLSNQNIDLPQSAGIQTAQMVVQAGAQAVITGQVGPKAQSALEQGNIRVVCTVASSVQQAIDEFATGQVSSPSQGQSGGQQAGRGMGQGGGMGSGQGRGLGRGMGQGCGQGMGQGRRSGGMGPGGGQGRGRNAGGRGMGGTMGRNRG